jgi:Asp-tRNA(Asn)/Glu-tRNA(Gln) amidotransferase A subunit family amidase
MAMIRSPCFNGTPASSTSLGHARIAPLADAAITLACPGPAPHWTDAATEPRPTNDPVFDYPSSMLFAPAVTVPMIGVGGMPVGVQLIGQQHEDARVTAMARWMLASVPPIVVE